MNDNVTIDSDRRAVIQRELAWHEEEAHRRYTLDSRLYDAPAFDSVVSAGLDFLATQPREIVLDMGCGEGKEVLALAQRNLVVIGTDLSLAQLRRTRELLAANAPDATVYLVQASAEELPFAAGTFRVVYGKAILHHLSLVNAAREVKRLLRPQGRATFAEPLSSHPLIWLGRRVTPELRTQDEAPMQLGALVDFGRKFAHAETGTAFLITPIAYIYRMIPGAEPLFRAAHAVLRRFDRLLFRLIPALRRFAWYGWVNVIND
jgi:SAM-dependent methyltransferase